MNIMTKCPKRSESTASRTIDNEAVIVIPSEGLVRVLNEVGAIIWQLLDGKHTVNDIVKIVSREFHVSGKEEVEKDILDFIEELKDKDMVELSDEPIM